MSLCALFLFVTLFQSKVMATGYEQPYCQDLRPQNSLDINQLMGMWYGVEIIPHLREEEGEVNYDSCPVIHLSESSHDFSSKGSSDSQYRYYGRYYDNPDSMSNDYLRPGDYGFDWNAVNNNNNNNYYGSQQDSYGNYGTQRSSYGSGGSYGGSSYGSGGTYGSYSGSLSGSSDYGNREFRHIRLYWVESGNNIEYHLKYNATRRGFWISSGPQGGVVGNSALQSQYSEFAGTVQVMKAVNDHIVLTFCQRIPDSQLFTAILSREPNQLSRSVLHSIHNLLSRRDLSTSSVRKVCRNGSMNVNASFSTMAAFTLLSAIVYFGFGKH